ncbi:MAG: RcnB family protein [Caulobacter sp.]
MKKLLSAVLAVTVLATAGLAGAQPYERQGQGRDQQHPNGQPGGQGQGRPDHQQGPDRPRATPARPTTPPVQARERRAERRYNAARYRAPRGYQQRHWRHGERLPAQYRTRGYVVYYRTYRLAPPPRGYQYVRVGNDVVLVSIRGGLISLVLMDLFR